MVGLRSRLHADGGGGRGKQERAVKMAVKERPAIACRRAYVLIVGPFSYNEANPGPVRVNGPNLRQILISEVSRVVNSDLTEYPFSPVSVFQTFRGINPILSASVS